MIKEAIVKIVQKQDLTYDEAYTVMNAHTERGIFSGTFDKERKGRNDR